jgi:hypothetical protein
MSRQYQYQLGQQVSSTLLPMQQPTHPKKEYQGIITGMCPESEQVKVKLTDPEYEGLEEWVKGEQIPDGAESKTESRMDGHERIVLDRI